MFTRTTTITAIAAALLGTITITPHIAGNANAAPPGDTPTLHTPTTTTFGPTTRPENIPVFHDTDEPTISKIDPVEIEVDPEFVAPRVKLNPCGVDPQCDAIELGGIRQLDLDGTGSNDGYHAHVDCYPGGLVQQVIATERSDGR